MHNKNTIGKAAYLLESLFWTALIFWLYRNIFFFPLLSLDRAQSLLVLAGIAIIGLIGGILLTYQHRRNYLSIFSNLVLSYGTYYIISFWRVTPTALITAGYFALGAVAAYCIIVLISYIGSKKDGVYVASGRQWLSACFLSCRTLVSLVLAFLLLTTGLKTMLDIPIMEFKPSELELTDTQPLSETISDNMDTIQLLQDHIWIDLDTATRLQVMKTVADIEATRLGIEPLSVCAKPLEEKLYGHYNDSTRTVTLNLDYLASTDAGTMLSTICHECYHSYQYRLVELYDQMDPETQALLLFQNALHYKEEFSNYIDGLDDYESYSAQWCELDSEAYAEEAVIAYYYHIYQYTAAQNADAAK